ncbi:SDR family oxidoreductase [Microbacterium sp. JB110]|uniref:SDR family oxidoreductase n=1 Tax=unclassified Microbacterium TaxID=2609290 RepID=UPI00097E8EC7|nr:SDR family oxidoreductase [Microbacterium sp. JB110]SJM48020.1 3-oxoacyl-[acyl-carrier protein] reductase [Frigoribacterium sp. JB110]
MFEDLKGRVAVVTGGAGGIGYSIATAYADQGMDVALLDLSPSVAESAAKLAADYGVRTTGQVVDVTDPDNVEAAFVAVDAELGTPTVLLAAAGLTIIGDSVDYPQSKWRTVMGVNVDGVFYTTQSFAKRALKADRPASAILISSMSGFAVNVPQRQAAYNASKAAVHQLAASLGVEWATDGVRVNTIAPGYVATDLTKEVIEADPVLANEWISRIPMGRMATPEDLHGLALYLASDASSYLTAQSIIIDGGYTAI